MANRSDSESNPTFRRPSVGEAIGQARLALRLMRDQRVPGWHKLIPALAVLYLFSPIDLLPEALVGPLGVIDDVTIMLLALRAFIHLAPADVVADLTGAAAPETIDTSYRVRED